MAKAENTYQFEDKRPAPKMQGKGPRPRTLLLAQAQAGQTRDEFVALVTDFMGMPAKAVKTSKVTAKAVKAAPKTDARTEAVDAAIATHAEATGKGINHFRAARKAALDGDAALNAYMGKLTGTTSIRGQLVTKLIAIA